MGKLTKKWLLVILWFVVFCFIVDAMIKYTDSTAIQKPTSQLAVIGHTYAITGSKMWIKNTNMSKYLIKLSNKSKLQAKYNIVKKYKKPKKVI